MRDQKKEAGQSERLYPVVVLPKLLGVPSFGITCNVTGLFFTGTSKPAIGAHVTLSDKCGIRKD